MTHVPLWLNRLAFFLSAISFAAGVSLFALVRVPVVQK